MIDIPPTRNLVLATHAVGAIACAALLGMGYAWGVAPQFAEGDNPADHAASVREAETDASLQEAVVQRLERELALSDETLRDQPMQLEYAIDVNRRVKALSDLAHAHGLVLTSSQPGDESVRSHYAFVPIAVGGDGRLADFVVFMGALHAQFPDVGVQGFEVTRGPTGVGHFNLKLNWFVQPARTAEVS